MEYNIQRVANSIARSKKIADRWKWDASKPHFTGPKELPLLHDRLRKLWGITITDFWPGKNKPVGWSILKHKWNKGLTLSYKVGDPRKEFVIWTVENETTITGFGKWITHTTFWERRFPKGFSFTVAKLAGKWRITRAVDPFMEASLASTPILSKEEWESLNDHDIIYDSFDAMPEGDKRYIKEVLNPYEKRTYG